MSLSIPLHLPRRPHKADALERLVLHANMAALNPKGFRTVSTKKNRVRTTTRQEAIGALLDE